MAMKVIYIVTEKEIIPEVVDTNLPANELLDNLIERYSTSFIGYTYSRPQAVELFNTNKIVFNNARLSLDEFDTYCNNIEYLERCLSLD